MHPTPRTLAMAVIVALLLAIGSVVDAAPALAQTSIVVAPGDTLYRIAVRHGSTVPALVRANGLRSADRIHVGQRLMIPSSGGQSGSNEPRSTFDGAHIVGPGENLHQIAVRYGTTISALVAANGLASADYIYVGQRLNVPGSGNQRAAPSEPASGAISGRRLVIDLSAQRLSAVENGRTIASFAISTGKATTPTPIGTYRIYSRYRTQRMIGLGYDLPNVPYVQYFTGAYALHGAYWHSNFGIPVSHGCINLRPADAGWVWSWSDVGTPVEVRW